MQQNLFCSGRVELHVLRIGLLERHGVDGGAPDVRSSDENIDSARWSLYEPIRLSVGDRRADGAFLHLWSTAAVEPEGDILHRNGVVDVAVFREGDSHLVVSSSSATNFVRELVIDDGVVRVGDGSAVSRPEDHNKPRDRHRARRSWRGARPVRRNRQCNGVRVLRLSTNRKCADRR